MFVTWVLYKIFDSDFVSYQSQIKYVIVGLQWKFWKWDPQGITQKVVYDLRISFPIIMTCKRSGCSLDEFHVLLFFYLKSGINCLVSSRRKISSSTHWWKTRLLQTSPCTTASFRKIYSPLEQISPGKHYSVRIIGNFQSTILKAYSLLYFLSRGFKASFIPK